MSKEESQLKKDIARLRSQVFGCEADAARELAKLAKEYPLYLVHGHAVPVRKYARKGKPAAGDEPVLVGFTLDMVLEQNEEAVSAPLNRKGRFLLATKDMDKEAYPASRMLSEYKEQLEVERGFRFLKEL